MKIHSLQQGLRCDGNMEKIDVEQALGIPGYMCECTPVG